MNDDGWEDDDEYMDEYDDDVDSMGYADYYDDERGGGGGFSGFENFFDVSFSRIHMPRRI
jgi:hypothetical protein